MDTPTALYVAEPYVASSPEAEVIGHLLLVFLRNLQSWELTPLLKQYNLEHIEAGAWYPHQNWFNICREISKHPNASENFVACGRAVVDFIPMPQPGTVTVTQAIEAANTSRKMSVRNAHPQDTLRIRPVAEGVCLVYNNTPNPDDSIYGMLWEVTRRYKGENESFSVRCLENPNADTEPGTLFEVVWGSANT